MDFSTHFGLHFCSNFLPNFHPKVLTSMTIFHIGSILQHQLRAIWIHLRFQNAPKSAERQSCLMPAPDIFLSSECSLTSHYLIHYIGERCLKWFNLSSHSVDEDVTECAICLWICVWFWHVLLFSTLKLMFCWVASVYYCQNCNLLPKFQIL